MTTPRGIQADVPESVLGAYIVAQLPGWIIAAFASWWAISALELRVPLVLLCLAGWVAKDFALYPFLRRFYHAEPPAKRMIGVGGVTVTSLEPEGLVRVGGELWKARTVEEGGSIPEGAAVQVRDIDGLVLFVEAHDAAAPSQQ